MDFSDIYERYARDVYRFALYLSGNRALAEDLTSETFVHALCGRSDVRVGTIKAYLFAIARNLYIAISWRTKNPWLRAATSLSP
jgi:RNA polymerase sigma-70 factor, ECF subfamily